jgi:hypothetical protein
VGHVAASPQEFISEFDEIHAETSKPTGVFSVLVGGDRSSLPQARWAMGKIHPQKTWATECPKLVPTLFGCPKFIADFPAFGMSQTALYP